MPQRIKIDKKHIIPCLSFVFFIGFLISFLSLIDITFTMSAFGVITTLCIIIFKWVKGSAEFFILQWEKIDTIAHLGLIGFAVLGFFIIIFYIFNMKITPKNNTQ